MRLLLTARTLFKGAEVTGTCREIVGVLCYRIDLRRLHARAHCLVDTGIYLYAVGSTPCGSSVKVVMSSPFCLACCSWGDRHENNCWAEVAQRKKCQGNEHSELLTCHDCCGAVCNTLEIGNVYVAEDDACQSALWKKKNHVGGNCLCFMGTFLSSHTYSSHHSELLYLSFFW